MTIEKNVLIQLKVGRPREGTDAFNNAARAARDLESGLRDVGSAGTASLERVAAGARAVERSAGGASRPVRDLLNELAKANKEQSGIANLSAQLQKFGASAAQSESMARRLLRAISEGAKVTEADLRRLAQAMAAVGGAAGGAPGGAPGGQAGGSRLMGGSFLSRFALPMLGASMLQGAGHAVTQHFATSVDDDVNRMARHDGGWQMGLNDLVRSVPLLGSIAGGAADWMTADARQNAEQSNFRLARQQRRNAQLAQERAIRTEGMTQERAAILAGQRGLAGAQIDAFAAPERAREQISMFQAERRFEGIGRQHAQEIEAFGRGDALRTESMTALRAEMGNRPEFGREQRYRLGQERSVAQQEVAHLQQQLANPDLSISTQNGQAQFNVQMQQAATLEQLRAARERLVSVAQREVELTRAGAEAETQRLDRLRQFATTAQETYRNLAMQERNRIDQFREQFGLMNELQRGEALQLARRAQANQGRGIQELSGEELQQLRGTGLFDEQIRGEANRRAGAAGFQEILQASGAQQRVQQAEQRRAEAAQISVELENRITQNFQINANDTAQQIAARLQPAMEQLMEATIRQITARTQQAIDQANQQAQQQFGLLNAQARPQ